MHRNGLMVRRTEAVGPPSEIVQRGAAGDETPAGGIGWALDRISKMGVNLWPTMFAYQFLFELEHDPARD